jgi:hypothetical protein
MPVRSGRAMLGCMIRLLIATALLVPALTACDGLEWVEGICMDDEVFIQHQAGGGDCRARKDSDPDCPDGEIPREQRPAREIDCIPNDVTKEPAYGE